MLPVEEQPVPEGVVNIGGEWFYEEYTPSTGVKEISQDGDDPTQPASGPATTEEKKGILDLFGNGKTE